MIIQSPPGVHVSDTQLHQRQHLTKIISHGTVEGLHDGRTCRAGGQAGGEARGQELQSLRPFHDQSLPATPRRARLQPAKRQHTGDGDD
jgi:hypothetical protein